MRMNQAAKRFLLCASMATLLAGCDPTGPIDTRQEAETRRFGYPFTGRIVFIAPVQASNSFVNEQTGELAELISRWGNRNLAERELVFGEFIPIIDFQASVARILGSKLQEITSQTRCMYFFETENEDVRKAVKQRALSTFDNDLDNEIDLLFPVEEVAEEPLGIDESEYVFRRGNRSKGDALTQTLAITQQCSFNLRVDSPVLMTIDANGGTLHALGNPEKTSEPQSDRDDFGLETQ